MIPTQVTTTRRGSVHTCASSARVPPVASRSCAAQALGRPFSSCVVIVSQPPRALFPPTTLPGSGPSKVRQTAHFTAKQSSRLSRGAPPRNRVTPFGELVAEPARGLVYGNRGCLHDEERRIRRRYAVKRWIACRLEFRGWKRSPLLQPGRFTELFFLDEATAFAAGHRPCALCRNEDYRTFTSWWRDLHPNDLPGADEIDIRLHEERIDPVTRGQRRHEAAYAGLPDGAFVVDGESRCSCSATGSCAGLPRGTPARVPARGRARRRS